MLKLTEFFKWCTILSGGLLAFSSSLFIAYPDAMYNFCTSLLPISRGPYDIVLYGLLGLYEFFFWCFCLIPFLALTIIGKNST